MYRPKNILCNTAASQQNKKEIFHQLRVLNFIPNSLFYVLNNHSLYTTSLFCLDCNELLNKIFVKRPIKKPGCPVIPQRSCPVAGLLKGMSALSRFSFSDTFYFEALVNQFKAKVNKVESILKYKSTLQCRIPNCFSSEHRLTKAI